MWIRQAAVLAAAILLVAHGRADAQTRRWEEIAKVRDIVTRLAFDPSKFVGGGDSITITYRGDDRGWPVYALAIQSECVMATRTPDCATRLKAHMVRAPAPPDMERPRERGSFLIKKLLERRATTPSKVAKALSAVNVEWLEADFATCPAASAVLQLAGEATWVQGLVKRRPKSGDASIADDVIIVIHADIVEVTFNAMAQKSTYHGYVADSSPARWAVDLMGALEPCWRPATSPPPWLR